MARLIQFTSLLAMFLLGWMMQTVVPLEQPIGITGMATTTVERMSPGDKVAQQDIHVYEDKIVIDIEDARWARFTDTNSMDPVLDYGAHGIQLVPESPEQIEVGDIISFRMQKTEGIIIHRVVEIGEDENGWYALTKGDNNAASDPGVRRFDDVTKVLVAVIY